MLFFFIPLVFPISSTVIKLRIYDTIFLYNIPSIYVIINILILYIRLVPQSDFFRVGHIWLLWRLSVNRLLSRMQVSNWFYLYTIMTNLIYYINLKTVSIEFLDFLLGFLFGTNTWNEYVQLKIDIRSNCFYASYFTRNACLFL